MYVLLVDFCNKNQNKFNIVTTTYNNNSKKIFLTKNLKINSYLFSSFFITKNSLKLYFNNFSMIFQTIENFELNPSHIFENFDDMNISTENIDLLEELPKIKKYCTNDQYLKIMNNTKNYQLYSKNDFYTLIEYCEKYYFKLYFQMLKPIYKNDINCPISKLTIDALNEIFEKN